MGKRSKTLTCGGGFTLTELIVVISIITILSALLIPALTKVRVSVLRAQCASNLRQIWNGGNFYAQDHDGCYPVPVDIGLGVHPNGLATPGLISLLGGYINDKKIFYCPDGIHAQSPISTGIQWTYAYQSTRATQQYMQMGYFWLVASGPSWWSVNLPQKLNGPSDRVLGTCVNFSGMPHQKKINFLFADGHIDVTSKVLSDINSATLLLK